MRSRKHSWKLPRKYPDTFQEEDGLQNILHSLKQGHMEFNCEYGVQALSVGIKHATVVAHLPALNNLSCVREGIQRERPCGIMFCISF